MRTRSPGLRVTGPLAWRQNEKGLTIAIPETLQDEKARPCQHAWALKIPRWPKVVNTRNGEVNGDSIDSDNGDLVEAGFVASSH